MRVTSICCFALSRALFLVHNEETNGFFGACATVFKAMQKGRETSKETRIIETFLLIVWQAAE